MKKQVQFYTTEEAADKLKISKSRLYQMIQAGYFPAYKLRDVYRIPKAPFDQWRKSRETQGRG